MSSPLPSNMALTTVRGRYGTWITVDGEPEPQFIPFVGMRVNFAPAYPFVTNTTAIPSPLVVATAPRWFQTDSEGYMSDPSAGFDGSGIGLNRNCQIVSSDDPDIWPRDWKYLVTFAGPGAINFRSFRTPAPAGATVDMAVITPQRVASGSTPSSAEIAAANAAASAAAAQDAVASINRGQAGGVAPLDVDGDVNDAFGVKVLPGGGGGSSGALADITGMSTLGKQLVATLISGSAATQALMRGVIGAGTGSGSSNLVIGTTTGTVPDAALTDTALELRALDADVVHNTGDEPIDGSKTFLDPIIIPAGVTSTDAVNKGQLDPVSTVANAASTAAGTATTNITALSVTVATHTSEIAGLAPAGTGPDGIYQVSDLQDIIANGFFSYANQPPGSRFDIKCIDGVQPLRATLSSRTDIFFDWLMDAQPSTAAGYAIQGDGWRREPW